MTDPIHHHAQARPTEPALVTPQRRWTWAEVDARVGATARRLVEQPHGVAAVVRPSPAAVLLVWAALRAGVRLVPLSPRWPPSALSEALDRLGLDHVVTDDPALDLPATVSLARLTAPGDSQGPVGALDLTRPFTVVHTSGTSGEPKAAEHTVGAHVASARGLASQIPLARDDRWLLDLPLAHVGGLGVVVRCALAGAAVAIPDRGMSLVDAVQTLAVTHASLVSTQLVRLLREERTAPGLRAILLGGSAMPSGVLDEAHARGLPVATSYGMTEMTSTVTATPPGAGREALATSGTVLPGRDLRLVAGEIQVRGATLFSGYRTAAGLERSLTADGWFATGDLGRVDEARRLVVGGRRGLQFVSGGENVQPEAIERALAALPGVAEAVVVPIPDEEFGARPVAFVRPRGEHLPPASDLATGLRRTLPSFMVPVAFHPWDGAGDLKPDRPALMQRAQAEHRPA